MKIKELLDSPKVTISCELFPPKKGTELQNAMDIVHAIAIDGVDYMSVTYGAGGTAVGKSLAIASEVERSGVPALAHLTCIGAKKDGIARVLRDMKAGGIDNVLALRGDRPQGMDELPESDFPLPATSSASSRKRGISAWAALPILRDILNRGPLMRIWRT